MKSTEECLVEALKGDFQANKKYFVFAKMAEKIE